MKKLTDEQSFKAAMELLERTNEDQWQYLASFFMGCYSSVMPDRDFVMRHGYVSNYELDVVLKSRVMVSKDLKEITVMTLMKGMH